MVSRIRKKRIHVTVVPRGSSLEALTLIVIPARGVCVKTSVVIATSKLRWPRPSSAQICCASRVSAYAARTSAIRWSWSIESGSTPLDGFTGVVKEAGMCFSFASASSASYVMSPSSMSPSSFGTIPSSSPTPSGPATRYGASIDPGTRKSRTSPPMLTRSFALSEQGVVLNENIRGGASRINREQDSHKM